jgi:mono/diheme cytochrome c family protein
MNETLFYVFGIALAVSAVVTAFIGLKVESFPGKAMPLVIVWFAILVGGAGTFAVLHGKDEDKAHATEYAKAGEEIEKEQTSGPFEESAGGESEESSEAEESGESEESAEPEAAEGGEEAGGAEAGGGGDPIAGKSTFAENCSVCHGATGHGGNGGPDLRTMPLAQTEEGAIEQVTHGGGGMPPFEGVLSEEEIENVAAYVSEDIVGGK